MGQGGATRRRFFGQLEGMQSHGLSLTASHIGQGEGIRLSGLLMVSVFFFVFADPRGTKDSQVPQCIMRKWEDWAGEEGF